VIKNPESPVKDHIPEVSVDCVVFGFHSFELKVLLLRLSDIDYWYLPRGPVSRNEHLGEAAGRVLDETTGIRQVFLQQFQAVGATGRYKFYSREQTQRLFNRVENVSPEDLSYESVISVGYYALVDFEKISPDSKGTYQWCEISTIPDLLFDHNDLIEMALVALRKDLRYLPIAKLLPEKFTLTEMQRLYETILDRKFDRRNFYKLFKQYDFMIRLEEKRTGTAGKPTQQFSIDYEKYEAALQDGISY
jgi:8-oxo-dGTP diphosphatase